MTAARWLVAALGFAAWAVGLYVFVDGGYVAGGALVLTGGLLFVLAASRGWGELWQGLVDWLYFWR